VSKAHAVRFLISGRVVGVGFRVFVRRKALALGLAGHAHNLADGKVEVLAVGEGAAIEALARALKRGPLLARVDELTRVVLREAPRTEGFNTG